MPRSVPESDWKLFRRLREVALERFCHSILGELEAICGDEFRSSSDRFRDAFSLLDRRNQEVARLFDEPRRSTMLMQLSAMSHCQLLQPKELAQFSTATLDLIRALQEATNP